MVSREQILEALRQVSDPELGASVVDLGLIRDVQIGEKEIHVRMVLTMTGCPLAPFMMHKVQQAVEAIAQGNRVTVELLEEQWVPPWLQEAGL
jgi:metal-sulfur cluster biosynthetic enzyme